MRSDTNSIELAEEMETESEISNSQFWTMQEFEKFDDNLSKSILNLWKTCNTVYVKNSKTDRPHTSVINETPKNNLIPNESNESSTQCQIDSSSADFSVSGTRNLPLQQKLGVRGDLYDENTIIQHPRKKLTNVKKQSYSEGF